MGHKINPRIYRANTTYQFASRWFTPPQLFASALRIDVQIRKMIRAKFRDAAIARIEIERSTEELTVIIFTAKPGMIIGRGGNVIEELRASIKRQLFGSEKMKITVNIQEVQHADMEAELIVQNIRDQLEKRIPFRRAIKRALEQVMRSEGAQGCKIQVAGRLNGAEIARRETVTQGRLPLHTLRANIDYSRGIAQTIYGVIGIKVWLYKGDVFGEVGEETVHVPAPHKQAAPRRRRRHLETGGQTMILRKRSDIEKEAKPETAHKTSTE